MPNFLRRAWARTTADATLDFAVLTAFAATLAVAILTTLSLGTRADGTAPRLTNDDLARRLSAQQQPAICPPRAPRPASEEAPARC